MLQLIYKLTYLITFCGASAIGIFVLVKGWDKKLNRVWFLLHLNVVIWSFGRYMMLFVPDSVSALFWARISTAGSFFIYPFFLYAILLFLEKKNRSVPIFFVISSVLFLINSIDLFYGTNFVVKGVLPKLSFQFYDEPNSLWALHLITTTACPLIAIYEMVKANRKASRVVSNRIKFIFFATVVGIVGGSTNVPLVYNIPIEPVGLPFVPVYLFLISYAIYKYRVMEINYFIYRGLSYTFLSALFVIPSVALFMSFLGDEYGKGEIQLLVLLVCILLFGVIMIPRLKTWTETTIGKTFMKDWFLYEEISRDFVNLITSTIDINKLAREIMELVSQKLQLKSASFYIIAGDESCYKLIYSLDRVSYPEKINQDSDFIRYFQTVNGAAVKEEIERAKSDDSIINFLEMQSRLHAEVSIPFQSKNKLIAILNLGPKRNENFFNMEEIDLLCNIGGQGAIALENALAVKVIEDLNVNLERKVKERTKELEATLTELKEMQVQLVQSEKMASIGVLSAGMAHEIYNPLTACLSSSTVLKKYLDNIGSGTSSFEELQGKCVRAVDRIRDGVMRMENIVTNLKRFSRKDVEGIKSNNIHEGLNVTLELMFDQIAEDIRIHKDFNCDEFVECNLGQVNQVFLNIVMNAVQALNGKGDLWIATSKADNHIEILFRDNGVGMSEEIIPHVFEPFFTTKDIGEGTGLGLSISQRIVWDHNGKIKVESKEGEGSSFVVVLPLVQSKNN